MNIFEKMQKICKPVRMILGAALVVTGLITGIAWFYLGVIPFIAGAVNFCPACIISKQCNV